MSKVTIFVGIDYHQDVVQVCVMDRQGQVLANQSVSNSVEGLAAVVAPHGSEVHAAIEACGGAAAMADALVTRLGWVVDMAHPGYVARIKQSPDKTDFSDARLLADLSATVGGPSPQQQTPHTWAAAGKPRQARRDHSVDEKMDPVASHDRGRESRKPLGHRTIVAADQATAGRHRDR